MQSPSQSPGVRGSLSGGCRRAMPCGTFLAVGALLLLACVTSAAQTPGIYEIPADSPIDVHDGSLSDWHAVVPGPAFRLADLTLTSSSSPLNPPDSLDMELDIYLGWAAEPPRIYAAFEMRDDVFETTWEGYWMPGGVQRVTLGIDADRQGGFWGVHHSEGVASYTDGQVWCLVFTPGRRSNEGGDFMLYPGGASTPWLCAAPWSALGGATDQGQQRGLVELMAAPFDHIPWGSPDASGSVLAELARGDTIGLYLNLVDYDQDADDTEQHWDTRKAWWLPDLATYEELDISGLSPTVPVSLLAPWDGTTSVEPRSWGQVKQVDQGVAPAEAPR